MRRFEDKFGYGLARVLRYALAAYLSCLAPFSVAAEPPSGTVVVKTVKPDCLRGKVVRLSLTNGLTLDVEGADIHVPAADLVRLTSLVDPAPKQMRETSFTLVGSDRVYGRLIEGNEEQVVMETSDFGRLTLPLEMIDRMETPLSGEAGFRDSVRWFDESPPDSEDRALLTNGDVTRGFVTAIDSEGVVIDGSTGSARIPHRLIVSLRMSAGKPQSMGAPHAVISLLNSGRLTVRTVEWREDAMSAQLVVGPTIECKPDVIVRVDFLGGRWEWLSEHSFISHESVPMLSMHWDSRPDRNVLGGPITVAGEMFERGIGVHSRSKLTFDLRGAYREFVTSYGIDDDSGPIADVSVQVLVDGQRRHNQAEVRRGTLHGPLRMDVSRAHRIELVVDYGKNGDLQDRFDWVEAALIRDADKPTTNAP